MIEMITIILLKTSLIFILFAYSDPKVLTFEYEPFHLIFKRIRRCSMMQTEESLVSFILFLSNVFLNIL